MLREPWRTRLLFASVAGNLFAVALIGAHLSMPPPRAGAPSPEIVMERMAHTLPPDDAGRFRAVMTPRLPALQASRSRMEEARAALSRAIAQTPYDETALRAAMQAWQGSWLAMSEQLGSSMMLAVADMSPDGRRRLAEAGMRRPRP